MTRAELIILITNQWVLENLNTFLISIFGVYLLVLFLILVIQKKLITTKLKKYLISIALVIMTLIFAYLFIEFWKMKQ